MNAGAPRGARGKALERVWCNAAAKWSGKWLVTNFSFWRDRVMRRQLTLAADAPVKAQNALSAL